MKIEWGPESNPYDAIKDIILEKFSEDAVNVCGPFIVQIFMRDDPMHEYEDITTLMMDTRNYYGDPLTPNTYQFTSDWWEGQKDILLVGAAPVSEVDLSTTEWNTF